MNRAEIRNLVIDHTGRSDKASLINSMITAALKKVSSEGLWRDLLTEQSVSLIVGQAFIALVAGAQRVSEVRIIDGLSSYELEVRPKSYVTERWPDFDSFDNGRPYVAYIEGRFIHMVPAPDTAFTLKYSYYKRTADLADDTTSLEVTIFDEAVIAFATYRTFKSLQMHEDAALWFADYREALKDAKMMDKSGVVQQQGTPRGEGKPIQANYWLNPFQKRVP